MEAPYLLTQWASVAAHLEVALTGARMRGVGDQDWIGSHFGYEKGVRLDYKNCRSRLQIDIRTRSCQVLLGDRTVAVRKAPGFYNFVVKSYYITQSLAT